MSKILKITISNWDKFNPKRDQKTYTWLRLDNRIAYDPKLFGLSPGQKYGFIMMLCEASSRNSGSIEFDLGWFSNMSGLKEKEILDLVDFLDEKGVTTPRDRALHQTTPDDRALPLRTNERTNEHARAAAPADADARVVGVLKGYPKKDGNPKTREGARKISKQLKTDQDFLDFERAMKNYAAYCERNNRIGTTYVKAVTTFASEWRDWLSLPNGSTESQVPSALANYVPEDPYAET